MKSGIQKIISNFVCSIYMVILSMNIHRAIIAIVQKES